MEHSSIPTKYRGIQMRSRLEARWAAYFDSQNLKWQYEPIDLNGWIPDFIVEVCTLIGSPGPMLVEVKPITAHEINNVAPVDVTSKIETALYLSKFEPGYHQPMLLGNDPRSTWMLIRGEWFHYEQCFFLWQDYWPKAGNAVQWKAPRRS